MSFSPHCIYLTHYGRLVHPEQHLISLYKMIDAYVSMAQDVAPMPPLERHSMLCTQLQALYHQSLDEIHNYLGREERQVLFSTDVEVHDAGLPIMSWSKHAVCR